MNRFEGIKPDALFLLAENRFRNEKRFYDEHREQIRRDVIAPLSLLIEDISPIARNINPDMILEPKKIVSRVRRDTRFTNDKTLYRENLWFLLRHQKNELPTPAFWFEISPSMYAYGCGVLSGKPAFMELWRKNIVENKTAFLRAIKPVKSGGFVLSDEHYKRSKAKDIPENLKPWYNLKEIYVAKKSESITPLGDGAAVVDELSQAISLLHPFYSYLLRLTKEYNTTLSDEV